MRPKRPLTRRGVEKLSERERQAGLDPDDEAARWLAENEPKQELTSEPSGKSKALHRWRQQQARRDG